MHASILSGSAVTGRTLEVGGSACPSDRTGEGVGAGGGRVGSLHALGQHSAACSLSLHQQHCTVSPIAIAIFLLGNGVHEQLLCCCKLPCDDGNFRFKPKVPESEFGNVMLNDMLYMISCIPCSVKNVPGLMQRHLWREAQLDSMHKCLHATHHLLLPQILNESTAVPTWPGSPLVLFQASVRLACCSSSRPHTCSTCSSGRAPSTLIICCRVSGSNGTGSLHCCPGAETQRTAGPSLMHVRYACVAFSSGLAAS